MSATTYVSKTPDLTPATAFLEFVQPDLAAVEERLNEEITSEVRKVRALSDHVLSAGGKRLRPAMVALSARAVNPEPDIERLTVVGASVELVHMATLVHDDVVDHTATRRGKPTANAVFGNGVAVLTGDFLLARAMRLLAQDGDLRVIRAISEITIEMSEGEVMEILATGDPRITQEHYSEILRKKTAVFVEGCCRCGAIVGCASPEHEAALAQYGCHLGMAFQIADDLLDYTGDPLVTGKPIGSDLRDGRATLPFLLALNEAHAADRDLILTAFGNAALDDAAVEDVVRVLERYDVCDRTRAAARSHVEQADAALSTLPPSRARDCFAALTDYVVQRDR
jgi:octaprenyl-diphosphate synthase